MAQRPEEHRFCDLNGERVFVVHHRPERPAKRAVVMCSPLGEEKLWSHRVFVSLARDLAAAGFAVNRDRMSSMAFEKLNYSLVF